MIYDFNITGPDRIISGIGALSQLGEALDQRGCQRALVLTGKTLATKTDLVAQVEAALGKRHAATFSGCAQHVPESTADNAVQAAMDADADSIVIFGGGSPIDTAKLVVKRMNDAGKGAPVQFVIPTTLSAGEFTHAAGLTSEKTRVKAVIVDPVMQPEVILYDPELTRPTPTDLWLTTGIKALDHAVEGVWWPNCHPFLETLRLGAIADLRANLAASRDPDALEARLACMHAAWKSIWGLLSASSVGFRLSHPLGHQIGARWDVPHGVTSCIALPAAARFLHSRSKDAQAKIAQAMDLPSPEGAAPGIEAFLNSLDVPRRLSQTDAKRDEIPLVAKAVSEELSHLGAPDSDIATPDALTELLESVW
ncbi:iron-containing alcohol dehydrogenase [Minwuia sp.]|uniref:iron-containing alcohol dehydrogenase n=1 Tax=Minwuia sp. TaxID=2493630 RepID=UPI003A8EED5A